MTVIRVVYFYLLKAHLEKKKQVVCTINYKKNVPVTFLRVPDNPSQMSMGSISRKLDSNSKVILPFIIVDFYSLKAHFHTKQEIGMLYVTLRNW